MDILAFDPGTEVVGIARLTGPNGSEIVWIKEFAPKGELVDRYKEITHFVNDLIHKEGTMIPNYYFALETPYVGFNPGVAIKLGTVRGLIIASIFTIFPEPIIVDVAPQELRRVFNLPIKSKKVEFHKIIKEHYDNKLLDGIKEDGLDAVAVGLTAATKIRKDLWWQQNG